MVSKSVNFYKLIKLWTISQKKQKKISENPLRNCPKNLKYSVFNNDRKIDILALLRYKANLYMYKNCI